MRFSTQKPATRKDFERLTHVQAARRSQQEKFVAGHWILRAFCGGPSLPETPFERRRGPSLSNGSERNRQSERFRQDARVVRVEDSLTAPALMPTAPREKAARAENGEASRQKNSVVVGRSEEHT